MRLLDISGRVIDAEFDVEATSTGADIVLHARSGGGSRGPGRNTAYFEALETLLARLGEIGATVAGVFVDSKVAQRLPLADRSVDLPYPLRLGTDTDALALRVRITEGQRTIATEVRSGRGGNKHKRIRISVDLTGTGTTTEALVGALATARRMDVHTGTIGAPYRRARPDPTVQPSAVFSKDSSTLERALRSHANVQNGLADFLRSVGYEPRSPISGEPDFDLAWVSSNVVVAEIKSLTGADPTGQLRLGLGQVLEYRRVLRHLYGDASAVLAVEHGPPPMWIEVCADADVVLTWPPTWPGLPR